MKIQHNSFLFVDIGRSEVRWCAAVRQGADLSLRDAQSAPLPVDQTESGARLMTLQSALQKGMAATGADKPLVYAALPKNLVFLRVIDAPRVSSRELRNILALRVQKEIPNFDPESVVWDFEVLPDAPESKKHSVVLAAIRKQALENFVNEFRSAGVEPHILDIEPLAVARWFSALHTAGSENVALVDIGHSNSSISLISGRTIRHFGQAPLSFSELTRDPDSSSRFTLEVQTALHAFNGTEAAPRQIVLCGDERISEFVNAEIAEQLNARVHHLSQITNRGGAQWLIPSNRLSGNSHVLESLAYRARTKAASPLANLAPQKHRASAVSSFIDLTTRAVSLPVLIAGTVAFALIFMLATNWMREKRTTLVQQSLTTIKPLEPQLLRLEQTVSVLKSYEKDRFNWLEILSEMNKIKPEQMTLQQLKMDRMGKCSMSGEVGGKTPIQIVEAFVTKLNDSPHFEAAQMSSIRPKQNSASFQIGFTLSKSRKGN